MNQKFLRINPPLTDTVPASSELLEAYDGKLPACLLALWSSPGLGMYGDRQICFIDPRIWQLALDGSIASPTDTAQRVPIALLPFGGLVYYRRLSADTEDISYIDLESRQSMIISYTADDFLDGALCNENILKELIPQVPLTAALATAGALACGEMYVPKSALTPALFLEFKRSNALERHARLRDEIAIASAPKASTPTALRDIIPQMWKSRFVDSVNSPKPSLLKSLFKRKEPVEASLCGLYHCVSIDRHRLLALSKDGEFHLLFFSTDSNPRYQYAPRYYTGRYRAFTDSDANIIVELDYREHDDAPSSDYGDSAQLAVNIEGTLHLMQLDCLESIGGHIHWNSRVRDADQLLARIDLDGFIVEFPQDGLNAPALADTPKLLRTHIRSEPLRATIVGVSKPEDEYSGPQVTLNIGENDGVVVNMPLHCAAGKNYHGWAHSITNNRCKLTISQDSADTPVKGEMMTSRDPNAKELI